MGKTSMPAETSHAVYTYTRTQAVAKKRGHKGFIVCQRYPWGSERRFSLCFCLSPFAWNANFVFIAFSYDCAAGTPPRYVAVRRRKHHFSRDKRTIRSRGRVNILAQFCLVLVARSTRTVFVPSGLNAPTFVCCCSFTSCHRRS